MQSQLEKVCSQLEIGLSDLKDVDVLLLPENTDTVDSSEQLYEAQETILLAKQLRASGLHCKTAHDFAQRFPSKERRGADVWLGLVWLLKGAVISTVGAALYDYLKERYRDFIETPVPENSPLNQEPRVSVDLRIQRDEDTTKLKFDGRISDCIKVVRALQDDEPQDSEV